MLIEACYHITLPETYLNLNNVLFGKRLLGNIRKVVTCKKKKKKSKHTHKHTQKHTCKGNTLSHLRAVERRISNYIYFYSPLVWQSSGKKCGLRSEH